MVKHTRSDAWGGRDGPTNADAGATPPANSWLPYGLLAGALVVVAAGSFGGQLAFNPFAESGDLEAGERGAAPDSQSAPAVPSPDASSQSPDAAPSPGRTPGAVDGGDSSSGQAPAGGSTGNDGSPGVSANPRPRSVPQLPAPQRPVPPVSPPAGDPLPQSAPQPVATSPRVIAEPNPAQGPVARRMATGVVAGRDMPQQTVTPLGRGALGGDVPRRAAAALSLPAERAVAASVDGRVVDRAPGSPLHEPAANATPIASGAARGAVVRTAVPGVVRTAVPGVVRTAVPGVVRTAVPGVVRTAVPAVKHTQVAAVVRTEVPAVVRTESSATAGAKSPADAKSPAGAGTEPRTAARATVSVVVGAEPSNVARQQAPAGVAQERVTAHAAQPASAPTRATIKRAGAKVVVPRVGAAPAVAPANSPSAIPAPEASPPSTTVRVQLASPAADAASPQATAPERSVEIPRRAQVG